MAALVQTVVMPAAITATSKPAVHTFAQDLIFSSSPICKYFSFTFTLIEFSRKIFGLSSPSKKGFLTTCLFIVVVVVWPNGQRKTQFTNFFTLPSGSITSKQVRPTWFLLTLFIKTITEIKHLQPKPDKYCPDLRCYQIKPKLLITNTADQILSFSKDLKGASKA